MEYISVWIFLITAHAFGKTKTASVHFRVGYFLYKNLEQIQSKFHPSSFTVAFIWCSLAGRLSFAFTSACYKTLLLIAKLNSCIALVRGLAMKMSSRYKKKHSTLQICWFRWWYEKCGQKGVHVYKCHSINESLDLLLKPLSKENFFMCFNKDRN